MQPESGKPSVHFDATSGQFEHRPVVNLNTRQWSKRPPKDRDINKGRNLGTNRPSAPASDEGHSGDLHQKRQSHIRHRWRRMRSEGFARPLTLDVENADLLGSVDHSVTLLNDRRRHALALLDELRADRDRIQRTTTVVGFVTSAFAGLAYGVVVGSMVLATFAPFEPSRPTLWERTG